MNNTIKNRIKNRNRLRAVTIALLAASFLTFTLPREFFDPHVGLDHDIFCRAMHALCADELFIQPPVKEPPPEPKFPVAFEEIYLTQYTDQLKDSRAPPHILCISA